MPSFFQPQLLSLFGILGTLMTALYWISTIVEKRKLRIAEDISAFVLR